MTRASPYASIGTRDVKTACPGDRPAAWTGVRQAAASWPTWSTTRGSIRRPLRIYSAEQLAERIAAEGADVVVVESDSVARPGVRPGLAGDRLDPRRPQQRRHRRRHRGRHPGAQHSGPQRRRGRRDGAGPAVRRHPPPGDRRRGCARRQRAFATAPSPISGSGLGRSPGRTAGLVGLGAVGRALRWRLAGLGLRVIAYDPYNDEAHAQPRRTAGARPTSSRCTHRSPTRPPG